MFKVERFNKILEIVNMNGTATTVEISEKLGASLATVRRDLNELAKQKRIHKIFGGAKSIKSSNYITKEFNMIEKNKLHIKVKNLLGSFASKLISDNDFIYMDAGTSVEAIVPYIDKLNVQFVTNSLGMARELSTLKYKVFLLPGEHKLTTDSIVGAAACEYLKRFNFSLGFFGTNGIDKYFGFTTPDINEAMVKTEAISRCKEFYIIADRSKIGQISQMTFADELDTKLITNEIVDNQETAVMKKLKDIR